MRKNEVLAVVALWNLSAAFAGAAEPAAAPSRWTEERLIEFLRTLVAAVHEKHVVKDESRPVFGMTYEFYRDGKNYQDMGLDSLHDGAWLMDALCTAHRADPGGGHLERLLRYQVPFYLKVLKRSDQLFPLIRKTDEDRAQLEKPMRGRLPLAWDDGGGFDLNTGAALKPQYNTTQGPNHLAQDVADALMNVWLSTRDPAVAEALALLHEERAANFGTVPPVAFAAGFCGGRPEWCRAATLPKFSPAAMPGYAGLFEEKGERPSAYDDPLAWQYGQAMAEASRSGEMSDDFIAYAALRAYGHMLAMELYYADRPWPAGLHFFDIQEPPRFREGTGRLEEHASAGKKLMGGRGIQIAWVAAAILPDLRRRPEVWDEYRRRHHEGEPVIRIGDAAPILDGKRDDAYEGSATLRSGGSSVSLSSDPRNLHILIESSAATFSFTIQRAGRVTGEAAVARIAAGADGTVTASTGGGETLVFEKAFRKTAGWAAELRVPYTVVPGQKRWINGVENGRYALRLDGGDPQVAYMLSPPRRIIDRLEAYVDGTAETWHRIWRELGAIPSGYRGPNLRVGSWELSDAGNYAHLIRLIGLRILDLRGRSEWQEAARQAPGPR